MKIKTLLQWLTMMNQSHPVCIYMVAAAFVSLICYDCCSRPLYSLYNTDTDATPH